MKLLVTGGAGYVGSVVAHQIVEAACTVAGRQIEVVEAPRRAGDSAVLVASSDRIGADLGWNPQKPALEAMISDAWQWTRAHPNGYE